MIEHKNNYCTNQWMILNYPAGSGGKFIGNCLFLFDSVAHWHGITGADQTVEYFKQTILGNSESWLSRELNNRWDITFFSRCYPRNNNLTTDEFNQLVGAHASEYFFTCWDNKSIIVDFWCKPKFPAFWNNTQSVTIVLDDIEIYKKLALSKLYKIKDGTIISLLDTPTEIATEENKKNASIFNNQYKFPLSDLDTFFDQYVKPKPWLEPWIGFEGDPDKFNIKISELVSREKFVEKFSYFEDLFKQSIPHNHVRNMHDIWSQANERQQKYFSSS